jgi:predicted DNA-binding transcriptional regulator YafY
MVYIIRDQSNKENFSMTKTETPRGERMAKILIHLIRNRRRRFTVTDLHTWLNTDEPVHLRNVQRDLKVLAEVHSDVVGTDRQDGKLCYFIHPDMRGKISLPIQKNGLLAFFLLKRIKPFFAPKAKTLEELAEAVTDRASDSDYELFEDLDEHLEESTFLFGEQSPFSIDGQMFNALLTSLVKNNKLKILYSAAAKHKPIKKIICPAKLVLYKGELYFICMSEYNPDHDFYIKLCRILSVELMRDTFVPDPKRIKRIKDRLVNSFGMFDGNVPRLQKVIVRFPAGPYYQHIFTEKQFHNSQKISTDKNGDTLISMNVPVGLDLINWVLSWPEAVVVEPEELKKEMLTVARTLLKKYGE